MKTDDLYGTDYEDLDTARMALEPILDVKFQPHDSLYYGGLYYRYVSDTGTLMILRQNQELVDDELVEENFPSTGVLLSVEGTEKSQELEMLLSTQTPKVWLLRRESY